jgi:DNA repair protein RadA
MKFSTGVKALDALLEGGIEFGVITHFFGSFGVGKSILAQQLSVTLLKETNLNNKVIFFDTEGSFNINKISKISTRFGLDPQHVLKNILYKRIWSFEEQEVFLKISEDYIKKYNVKLIVIDCLTTHLRSEFNQDVLALRQSNLETHLNRLLDISEKYDVASVITNQVISGFVGENERSSEKPVGGNIIVKYSKYSIRLVRLKNRRYATLFGVDDLDTNFAPFIIADDGIRDEIVK